MSKHKKNKIYYPLCQIYSTTVFFFKFDFQKVDQYAGGKWLIHDTKRRKDNQLQSLKYLVSKYCLKHIPKVTSILVLHLYQRARYNCLMT